MKVVKVTYRGSREPGEAGPGRVVVVEWEKQTMSELDPRRDLYNHSPTGFQWGYSGSGPAQLALAILAHHLQDDERAVRLHQYFKRDLIAPIDGDAFEITSDRIDQWLEEEVPRALHL